MSKKFNIIFKLIVTVIIVILLIKDLDFFKVLKVLENLKLSSVIIPLFISLSFPLVMAKRWEIINNYFGSKINFEKSLRIIIIGQTGSSIIGLSIVNEIIKFFKLDKRIQILDKFKIIILDKVYSIFFKLLLLLIIAPFFFEFKYYFITITSFILLFILIIFLSISNIGNSIVVIKTLVLSLIQNLLIISAYLFICKSLNLNIDFLKSILFLSIELITQIFSFWGVRELSATYITNLVYLNKETGLTIGLLFTIINLISLIFYILIFRINLVSKFK
ncbi:MAG: flippase-like domain-containing protein [Pelagibacteraceae bacterium]|nr:flippase-like domain-containing protein [Pelagibacteraceae bacterium]MCI5078854.1 flippase-like domain-containing protein [Pelagibacteraceae bacterium]